MSLTPPRTWPARYRIHKYWGRKPGDVVRAHVERHTRPGETVLDLFSGSGVTVVESVLAGRDAIGVEINPIAVRLGEVLLTEVAPEAYAAARKRLLTAIAAPRRLLYGAPCPDCGAAAELLRTSFEGERAVEARLRCPRCGMRTTDRPPAAPRREALALPPHPDAPIFPGWQMRKLVRAGLRDWAELFTPRNLAALAHLHATIGAIADPAVRRIFLVAFTGALAQASRMIGDYHGEAGGPSWKINVYWLPERWQELNAMHYFLNRLDKVWKGVEETARLKAEAPRSGAWRFATLDCRALDAVLPEASVDYVFTDPPYGGEGIQYGELSMLWNLWLGERQRLDDEIAFNPPRGLCERDYADGLAEAFRQAWRVLRPGRRLTVTFANKDPRVWQALLSACRGAGFELEDVVPLAPSAAALTQSVAPRAQKADQILTFVKPACEG